VANSAGIAILGATSSLGQSIAREALAADTREITLLARDKSKMQIVVDDLTNRGGLVEAQVGNFTNISQHDAIVKSIANCTTVYVVYGTLPDQEACEQSWAETDVALATNFTSVISLLTRIANVFEKRGHGTIVVVSSVAGERGRKSNYVYGAAKGGLSIFCDGLRNRLYASGVHVLCVKPGFIDTAMTAHIEKKPAVLWVGPDKVAKDIINAAKQKKNTLYTPWFWRYIMLIITSIPEVIFKRLSL